MQITKIHHDSQLVSCNVTGQLWCWFNQITKNGMDTKWSRKFGAADSKWEIHVLGIYHAWCLIFNCSKSNSYYWSYQLVYLAWGPHMSFKTTIIGSHEDMCEWHLETPGNIKECMAMGQPGQPCLVHPSQEESRLWWWCPHLPKNTVNKNNIFSLNT